jgi:hypothetical protein
MKNTYKITIIDYNKLKKLTFENSIQATSTIYKNGFAEVIAFLGGRPHKQRAGWTALKGNTEYIIQRI